MVVLVKWDANDYPVSTVLPEAFDEEMHGAREDWEESTLEAVNAAAEANEPA